MAHPRRDYDRSLGYQRRPLFSLGDLRRNRTIQSPLARPAGDVLGWHRIWTLGFDPEALVDHSDGGRDRRCGMGQSIPQDRRQRSEPGVPPYRR